jgi:hypothetical protein
MDPIGHSLIAMISYNNAIGDLLLVECTRERFIGVNSGVGAVDSKGCANYDARTVHPSTQRKTSGGV